RAGGGLRRHRRLVLHRQTQGWTRRPVVRLGPIGRRRGHHGRDGRLATTRAARSRRRRVAAQAMPWPAAIGATTPAGTAGKATVMLRAPAPTRAQAATARVPPGYLSAQRAAVPVPGGVVRRAPPPASVPGGYPVAAAVRCVPLRHRPRGNPSAGAAAG